MDRRNRLAVAILIGGALASFLCYQRISELVPMSVPDMVTSTQATVTQVHIPMVKKGGTTGEATNTVRFTYQAAGKRYDGTMSIRDHDNPPEMGAKLPVVYFTRQPDIVLQQAEYDDLPRELRVLRILMIVFALTAIIAPFAVMKHG